MKNQLHLMARYNRAVNGKLYGILGNLDAGDLSRGAGSFFGGIIGLLNHVLVADLGWLQAFRGGSLNLPALNSPLLDIDHPGWGKILHEDFGDLRAERERFDDLFVSFVEETPAETFLERTRMTHHSGAVRTFVLGEALMHVFNHQTHHRGAVSQILDEMGVENDYSNLLALLME